MWKVLKEVAALVIAVIEILLIFRFGLKFFGANPQSPFVGWVYEVTQVLLRPFSFAFPTASVRGGLALEFTTLFAIFAYAFIGYVIQEGLEILLSRAHVMTRTESTETTTTEE